MTAFHIRPITSADFEGFHACLDAVARERKYLGHVRAPSLQATRKWLTASMQAGTIRLVALIDAQVVGWCDIERPSHEGFEHSGRLGMGVLKAHRRKGIGRELLVQSLALARDRGLERVELDVYASNTAAIRLYEQFGFQVEGRKHRARKLDGRYDDLIMMALWTESVP